MRLSIIIPVYNGARYIRETIESILSQNCSDVEIIVMDGLSTDQTVAIVQEYRDVKLISEADKGQTNAINKGFQLCTGDIVAWQNADDIYSPSAFETVFRTFEQDTAVDLIYGNYHMISADSRRMCTVYPIEWNEWKFAHGRFVPMQPTAFWRHSVIESVGPLDESLKFCMDVDFFARAVTKGFRWKKVNEVLGSFRSHSDSLTTGGKHTAAIHAEHRQILSRRFEYRRRDYWLFEMFWYRSKLASVIKRRILPA